VASQQLSTARCLFSHVHGSTETDTTSDLCSAAYTAATASSVLLGSGHCLDAVGAAAAIVQVQIEQCDALAAAVCTVVYNVSAVLTITIIALLVTTKGQQDTSLCSFFRCHRLTLIALYNCNLSNAVTAMQQCS
jgi:6,7-dimethyl-8-ribityllumazine synthase